MCRKTRVPVSFLNSRERFDDSNSKDGQVLKVIKAISTALKQVWVGYAVCLKNEWGIKKGLLLLIRKKHLGRVSVRSESIK